MILTTSICQTYDHVKVGRREKKIKEKLDDHPPTHSYVPGKGSDAKGIKLHPNESVADLRERRSESVRILYLWPTHHPALTPSPYTGAVLKEESRKLNPTRNAVCQSEPRVEQLANRLRRSHILRAHMKVQRFRAQLQNQSRSRDRSVITQKQRHRHRPESHRKIKLRETQKREKRGTGKNLTGCISARVQTRAHNFQPKKTQSSASLRVPDSCRRIGR